LLLSGLVERAERLGYNVEPFEVGPGALRLAELIRILTHRGIQGILVAPLSRRVRGHLRLPWDRFSTVVIGLGLISPPLHRVHHHHFQGMLTTLTELGQLGFQRIGFSIPAVLDQRMFSAWSAAFLAHHPLGPAAAARLLNRHQEGERQPFLDWLRSARPDVLIQSGLDLAPWLKPLPPSRQPRLVTLSWNPQHPQTPGIDQRSADIGRAAIDLLAAQLHHNERGIPDCAKTLMIEGRWQPGSTLTPAGADPAPPPR
jgi:DNA-binding LacI/PurR family transcriptional regulator